MTYAEFFEQCDYEVLVLTNKLNKLCAIHEMVTIQANTDLDDMYTEAVTNDIDSETYEAATEEVIAAYENKLTEIAGKIWDVIKTIIAKIRIKLTKIVDKFRGYTKDGKVVVPIIANDLIKVASVIEKQIISGKPFDEATLNQLNTIVDEYNKNINDLSAIFSSEKGFDSDDPAVKKVYNFVTVDKAIDLYNAIIGTINKIEQFIDTGTHDNIDQQTANSWSIAVNTLNKAKLAEVIGYVITDNKETAKYKKAFNKATGRFGTIEDAKKAEEKLGELRNKGLEPTLKTKEGERIAKAGGPGPIEGTVTKAKHKAGEAKDAVKGKAEELKAKIKKESVEDEMTFDNDVLGLSSILDQL